MPSKPFLSPASVAILRDWLLGGALVGGAAGSGAALYNHVSKLRQKADEVTDTSGDDDRLYVNVPGVPKRADVNSWVPGVAVAGAPLAALGTAELVRRLFSRYRKQELQKELDQAQQVYLGALRPKGPVKQAGAVGMAEALPLFLLLGTGLISYETMKKQFPDVKPAKDSKTPRMVIRREPGMEEGSEDATELDGMTKMQSAEADEHLFRTVLHLPKTEYLNNLVDAACVPEGPDLVLKAASAGQLFDFAKAAAAPSPTARSCAIGWIIRDAELAPAVKLACAAEILEQGAPLVALGHAAADVGLAGDLRKLAALHNVTLRTRQMVKAAAMMQPMAETMETQDPAQLADVLRQALAGGQLAHGDPQSTIMSLDSEETGGSGKLLARPGLAQQDEDKDLIDEVLAPQPSPAAKAKAHMV